MKTKYLALVLLTFLSLVATISAQNFQRFESCLRFRGLGTGSVAVRGQKGYDDLNYQFRLNPPQIYPRAYVLPSTKYHVRGIVLCGRTNKIQVTARCGGHQYEKYAYGNNNSVVIDLRRMNQVLINKFRGRQTTATIGGGSILGPTAYKLWKNGQVFFPIGLCATVGIGGLAPGGGHGLFTRKFGLTQDWLQEMEVVTPSGSLLTVNSDKNPDLFWALRGGGGGSFGIITSFTFDVIPPPKQIFDGILIFDVSDFPPVFDAYQRMVISAPQEVTPFFRVINQTSIELRFFDCSGTSNSFERFEAQLPISRSRSTSTLSYPEMLWYSAKNFAGTFKRGVSLDSLSDLENLQPGVSEWVYGRSKTFFAPKYLDEKGIELFRDMHKEMPLGVRTRFEAYGGAVNNHGATDTAFVHRSQNLYSVRATVDYARISDPTEADNWLERFFNFGLEVFQSTESYQNYPDGDMENYLERYYGENLDRLISIKRKYDPEDYFNYPQSIPPFRRPAIRIKAHHMETGLRLEEMAKLKGVVREGGQPFDDY